MDYLRLSEYTLQPYGGVFHVQAGEVEVIEGDWNPKVLIVAEFPSMDKVRAAALKIKPVAMDRNMILVKGLSEG